MAIYDSLPTYHQVEPNNLKGLQAGFVVAQMEIAPAATATLLTNGMFENGHVCGISADGIVAAGSDTKVLFLHYSEPLSTVLGADKFFAVDPEQECGRLVQLIPGDEWMSDMAVSSGLSAHIVELGTNSTQSSDDWYKVNTLADGTSAHHYMYIG